jgi:hypothetical protein
VITAVLIRNDDNIVQLQEDTQCGDHNIIPFLVMRLLLVLCNHPILEFQLFVLSLPRFSSQREVEQYAGGGCSYGCMSDRIVQIRTSQPQQKEKFLLAYRVNTTRNCYACSAAFIVK